MKLITATGHNTITMGKITIEGDDKQLNAILRMNLRRIKKHGLKVEAEVDLDKVNAKVLAGEKERKRALKEDADAVKATEKAVKDLAKDSEKQAKADAEAAAKARKAAEGATTEAQDIEAVKVKEKADAAAKVAADAEARAKAIKEAAAKKSTDKGEAK